MSKKLTWNSRQGDVAAAYSQTPTSRDVISTVFKHKWKLLAVFLLIAGGITLLTFALPEIYASDAKVLVKLSRESLFSGDPAVSVTGTDGGGVATTSIRFEVQSQLDMLNNRLLAEQVVDELGPEAILTGEPVETLNPVRRQFKRLKGAIEGRLGGGEPAEAVAASGAARDMAVRQFRNNLELSAKQESSVINISYEAKDPLLAHQALSTLLDKYLVHNIEVHSSKATPEFFATQTAEKRRELEAKEAVLRDFREKRGITDESAMQQNTHEKALTELRTEMADARSEVQAARARIEALEGALQGRSRTTELQRTEGGENRAADVLKEQRVELQREVADLESLYPDDHRLLRNAREELAIVDQALAQEEQSRTTVTTGVDQHYETLKYELDMARADFESANARAALLEEEFEDRRTELAALIGGTAEMQQLQREVDLLREEYMDFRTNYHLTEVNQALDRSSVSNLSIVQPASLPVEPSRPNKPLNIAAGIILGLVAALGLAFTLYFLDDSVKTSQDVEKHLKVPVLATITEAQFKKCI